MITLIAGTLMLAAFIAPHARDIPDRYTHLKDGIHGIAYTPIVWAVMTPAAITAHHTAQHIPALQWGWVGHNILISPLTHNTANTGTTTTTTTATPSIPEIAAVTVFFLTLVTAFAVFNYDEETWGRKTWWHVAGWAISHLIMGIPVYAVIPIFAGGIVFKLIHDRHDRNTAFATHLATNTSFAALLSIILILT